MTDEDEMDGTTTPEEGEPDAETPEEGTPSDEEQEEGPPVLVPVAAPFVEPPKLEGVLWRGETGMALIEGEAYRSGDKVKNTNFRVVEVGRGSVRLRTDQGQELVLFIVKGKP